MSSVPLKPLCFGIYLAAFAIAQSVNFPAMDHLKASETLQVAKLSSSEVN
jgi:hypothetical protein